MIELDMTAVKAAFNEFYRQEFGKARVTDAICKRAWERFRTLLEAEQPQLKVETRESREALRGAIIETERRDEAS